MIPITVTVDSATFNATLEDNEATQALLSGFPMTVNMSDLNGNEKYYYLDSALPTNTIAPGTINEGDIMLYQNNCLVLFYESFSTGYRYTRLGVIDNPEGLAEALGSGSATVTFAQV